MGEEGRSLGGTCGWGCFSFRCLQRFKRLPWLATCLCVFSFLNGMNYGNFNVALTSLERRFGFSSKQSGFLATAAHIGGLSAILFVSHFGATSHKPRILAVGAATCAASSALRALPHFLEGPYDYTGQGDDVKARMSHLDSPVCDIGTNVTERTCGASASHRQKSSQSVMYLLVIGQLLAGAGFSPMASLAPLIFEECMGGEHTPLFVAINNAIGALGIAAGYLLGALSLRLFVDLGREVHIENKDPRWIGAWWLLFVITSSLLTLDAICLFGFPSKIPSRESLATASRRESSNKSTAIVLDYLEADSLKPEEQKPRWEFFTKLMGIPRSCWKLLKIPAFTLMLLVGILEVLIFSSISSFGTKLFEENFQFTSSHAGLAMGSVATIGGAGGTLGGGLLLRKLRMSSRTIAKLCSISALVASVASLSFIFYCRPRPLAGFQAAYKDRSFLEHQASLAQEIRMDSLCNAPCHCGLRSFSPVCGPDDVTYFSPCHAGCSTSRKNKNSTEAYVNCRCIERPSSPPREHPFLADGYTSPDISVNSVAHYAGYKEQALEPDENDYRGEVTKGKCGSTGPCPNFYAAVLFLILGVVFRSLMITPLTMLILRCVPVEEKAFSLGLEWLASKLLGTIPGPVVMGTIIDSACAVWQSSCKGRGQCWVYSLGDLNLRLSVYWFSTCILSAVLAFCGSRYLTHETIDGGPKSFSFTIPPPLNLVPPESSDSEDSFTLYEDSTKSLSLPDVMRKDEQKNTTAALPKPQRQGSSALGVRGIYDNASI